MDDVMLDLWQLSHQLGELAPQLFQLDPRIGVVGQCGLILLIGIWRVEQVTLRPSA